MPEDDIPSRKTKSQRLMDFMSPSERVLRVHRKNFACARALRLQMEEYDIECRRSLRKVEQEIFDIYFDEYLPLKAQARLTPNNLKHLNTVSYIPNIHIRKSRANVKFPIVHGAAARKSAERRRPRTGESASATNGKRVDSRILPSALAHALLCYPGGRPSPESRTSSPVLEPTVTQERLRMIEHAVALSSQPPPPPPKRKKKKDRSRKLPIITVTEVSGEEESRKNSIATATPVRGENVENKTHQSQDEHASEVDRQPDDGVEQRKSFPSNFAKSLLRWRPSFDKNKIANDEETDTNLSKSEIVLDDSDSPVDRHDTHWDIATNSPATGYSGSRRSSGGQSSSQYDPASSSGLTSPEVALDLSYCQDLTDGENTALSSYYSFSQSSYPSSEYDN